ncbi:MAG: hypothetical protein K5683_09875 [Prevotella sp.]|nr:hypothetical protein [Prevotella sp.]
MVAQRSFIDGSTTEPVTITTEKDIYRDVTLPYMVSVKRHKLDGQRISIKSQSKRYKDIVLEKTINEWAFGNILLGGIIGWGVDLITNCVCKPDHNRFNIDENVIEELGVEEKDSRNKSMKNSLMIANVR